MLIHKSKSKSVHGRTFNHHVKTQATESAYINCICIHYTIAYIANLVGLDLGSRRLVTIRTIRLVE